MESFISDLKCNKKKYEIVCNVHGAHVLEWLSENTWPTLPEKPLVACLINRNGFIQMKLYVDYVTECKEVGVKSRYATYYLYVDVITSKHSRCTIQIYRVTGNITNFNFVIIKFKIIMHTLCFQVEYLVLYA